MKLESNLPRGIGPLHLAPMLDVVMLLAIFLLVGGSFVLHSGVAVDVPVANSVLQVDAQAHVVTLAPHTEVGGRFTFNGLPVTMAKLETALEDGRAKSRQVIVRADKQAFVDDLIRISSLAKSFGYDVALSTGTEDPR